MKEDTKFNNLTFDRISNSFNVILVLKNFKLKLNRCNKTKLKFKY